MPAAIGGDAQAAESIGGADNGDADIGGGATGDIAATILRLDIVAARWLFRLERSE